MSEPSPTFAELAAFTPRTSENPGELKEFIQKQR